MDSQLVKLINTLNISNFRELVCSYNKEKYNTKLVRIIDGPYDGGNDIEIIVNGDDIKRNLQVTVQKIGYESKLEEDIQKAKANVDQYNYLRNLDFYISQSLSKEKRNKLETEAERKHGIVLKIIDATIIANDSKEFTTLRHEIYKHHGITKDNINGPVSKQDKIVFDILTLNKNTIGIRKNLIYSFIFSFLYTNPESSLEDIILSINSKFKEPFDKHFLYNELNQLKSKRQIKSNAQKKYFLSPSKYKEINALYGKIELEEKLLNDEINKFISDNSIECKPSDLLSKIHKIYAENYNIDVEEIKNTSNSFSSSLKKSFNDLKTFFARCGINKDDTGNLAKKLIYLCSSKEYLLKIATTNLFTNLYNSDKLEAYISNRKIKILLDTQILIRLLCIYYKPNHDFEEHEFKAINAFRKCVNTFSEKIIVQTSSDYINEVVGHISEALNLERFLNLPYLQDFGVSKNVYFNTYLNFKKQLLIEDDVTLREFIFDVLDIDEEAEFTYDQFHQQCFSQLKYYFEIENIEIINHPNYDNYDLGRNIYEKVLKGKNRTTRAKINDLKTALYLSDKSKHIDPSDQLNEPTLITWDSSFYGARNAFKRKSQLNSFWYIYSPYKFIDRISVSNFKVEPNCISHNIVALAESNFNYTTNNKSFFDIISTFFNIENLEEINVLKKIARLKRETEELENIEEGESILTTNESVWTNILTIVKDYFSGKSKFDFDSLIKVFENNSNEDKIMEFFIQSHQELKVVGNITHSLSILEKLIESQESESIDN